VAITVTDYDAQRGADDRERAERAQRRLETREIMATPTGRRFLARWLERCGVFTVCYDPSSDRNTTFNLGMRNVGLMLMADLEEAGVDLYAAMLKERQIALTAAEQAGAETAPS